MSRKDIEIKNELQPHVDLFCSPLGEWMRHKDFEAMRSALLSLCTVCYKIGKLAGMKEVTKEIREIL